MLSTTDLIGKHPEATTNHEGGRYRFWNLVSFSQAIDAIPLVVQLTRADSLPLSQMDLQLQPVLIQIHGGAAVAGS